MRMMLQFRTICPAVALLGTLTTICDAAELRPETVRAWNQYVALTEKRIHKEIGEDGASRFLVLDHRPEGPRLAIERRLRLGEVFVDQAHTLSADGQRLEVPSGLIHHWVGVVFIPNVKLERVLEWVQNYSETHRYFSEVERSQLLNRNGDTFEIFLRLRRKKILTVHYNTEHRVTYRMNGPDRASSVSVASKIAELDQPGTDAEREKAEDESRGFLWRLRSYWRFEERSDGVWVECESLSLSRGIPKGAAWMIQRFVKSVPRESLEAALEPLRAVISNQ